MYQRPRLRPGPDQRLHSPVDDCHEVNYPERCPEEEISRGGEEL